MSIDYPIKEHKAELIDKAFNVCKIASIADLGACWGVNGGYTFHALSNYPISTAFIVDGKITELTRLRSKDYKQLELIQTMLGSDAAVEQVGEVDALIIFDVLLHQVSPDWDEFLEKWCSNKKCLIIYNQNWAKSEKTIRFVDRGLEWFKKNVNYSNPKRLEQWFSKHNEFCEEQGKLYRDIHNYWQWGIVKEDLVNLMSSLGFFLKYEQHYGACSVSKPWIVNEGFIFCRK